MHSSRALKAVDELIGWIDRYDDPDAPPVTPARRRDLDDRIRGRLPLVAAIAREIDTDRRPFPAAEEPGPAHRGRERSGGDGAAERATVRAAAIRLRGILADRRLVDQILGPGGTGPERLHPWVWGSAERLWAVRSRRAALQTAAAALEAQIQGKTGRFDLSGPELVRDVFRPEPPRPGEPRLRFDYEPGSAAWRSAQLGAMNLAAGCMLAIRPIASHGLREPDEAEAFEQLATLSLVARWVDRAAVDRVAPV